MKKKLKLFLAFAMISTLISFAACNLATEEELLASANASSGTNGGNDSGTNTGGSGSSDTIGDSWGALFSDTNHNPVDLQVWQGFDTSYDSEYGMKATVIGTAWFGGAIVQNCSAAVDSSIYYDMSSVEKMTFKVKASQAMTIWAGYVKTSKSDDFVKQTINVTTDWQTITITQKGVAEAWSIFAFGSDGSSDGAWLAFKDVTYLDSEGQNVTLKYAQ